MSIALGHEIEFLAAAGVERAPALGINVEIDVEGNICVREGRKGPDCEYIAWIVLARGKIAQDKLKRVAEALIDARLCQAITLEFWPREPVQILPRLAVRTVVLEEIMSLVKWQDKDE